MVKQPDCFKKPSHDYEISHFGLQSYITSIWPAAEGHELCIPAMEEVSNGMQITVYTEKDGIDEYDLESVVPKILQGKYSDPGCLYHLNTIMCMLCKEGHILPGKYLVNVFW